MSLRRFLRIARQRLRSLFRRDSVDLELSDELSFHFDQLVAEYIDNGMTADQARNAARRAIGNIPLLEEQCRDTRAVTWVQDVRQDVVYGLRMLRRNPGFTLVAVLSLALGIGANTAMLSVIDAVLRGGLPIPHDDRLVVLRTYPFDGPEQETHALVSDYFAWLDENRSFDLIGASMGNSADFGAESEGAPPERIGGQLITPDTFSALGVKPTLGRVFVLDDTTGDVPARVIIISHRLWQQRFGGRSDIIGRELRLDRVNRTVVGVMPTGFQYPSDSNDYWIPFRMDRAQERNPQRFFVVTARLKPGVTIEQAQSDIGAISARLVARDPDRHEGWGVRVKPLREAMFGWTRDRLYTLEAAVALVLLVACLNLAGLLTARGLARGPEIALRAALGAGRGRIVRQLLTESILLSTGGGLLGLTVAWIGIRALVAMEPPPGGVGILEVPLSLRTLGATAVIAVATGLVYGLGPALMHARSRLTDPLREPVGGGAIRRPRFRSALVAAQIAVTIVLLVGAGLLMKSFVRIVSRDLQFDPTNMLTFELHIPLGDYLHRQTTADGRSFFEISPPPSILLERVYRDLAALPGVESVAGVSFPLVNSVVVPSTFINVDSTTTSSTSEPSASLAIGVAGAAATHVVDRRSLVAAYFLVTPSFFTSVKTPIVSGRDFAQQDVATSQWVAIVNESAAHRFWPGVNPVGRQFTIPNVPAERPRTVVGIVRDIPLTLRGELRPVIYTPFLQQPTRYPTGTTMFGQMVFMVRTSGDPMNLLPSARRVVASVDPDRPLATVGTMEQRLAAVVPQRGYFVFAVTAFALVAMLLAVIGIYGVMAYTVAQRTREIGIRVALGAAAHEVAAVVGRRTMLVVSFGLLTGLIGALIATRMLQSQLWGVTPTDPATFASMSLLLALVALVAAFFPMRRAISVDPTIALRSE
ncbi:MAG TPA: ABC transporter permease [Vicinamibacterales bacterium]|jgi:predicted permease